MHGERKIIHVPKKIWHNVTLITGPLHPSYRLLTPPRFLPSNRLVLSSPPYPSSGSEHTCWLLQRYPKLHDYSTTLAHSSPLPFSGSPPFPSSGSKHTYWLVFTPVQFHGPSFLWRDRCVTWCLNELTHISVSWRRLSERKTRWRIRGL